MKTKEIKRIMSPELFHFWTVDVFKYEPEKVERSIRKTKELLNGLISDGLATREHIAHLELLNQLNK